MDAIEKVAKPWSVDLRDKNGREPVYGISRFIPVYGDDVLPDKPVDALRKGAGRDVEVVIGTNADEMNLYFVPTGVRQKIGGLLRSEEHTSELQSLMRISYAVFCLKKKKDNTKRDTK